MTADKLTRHLELLEVVLTGFIGEAAALRNEIIEVRTKEKDEALGITTELLEDLAESFSISAAAINEFLDDSTVAQTEEA